jgi:Mg2+ and Co2+ transporter CorA
MSSTKEAFEKLLKYIEYLLNPIMLDLINIESLQKELFDNFKDIIMQLDTYIYYIEKSIKIPSHIEQSKIARILIEATMKYKEHTKSLYDPFNDFRTIFNHLDTYFILNQYILRISNDREYLESCIHELYTTVNSNEEYISSMIRSLNSSKSIINNAYSKLKSFISNTELIDILSIIQCTDQLNEIIIELDKININK